MKKKIWNLFEILLLSFLILFYSISAIFGGIIILHIIFNLSYITAGIIWILISIFAFPIVMLIDNKTV